MSESPDETDTDMSDDGDDQLPDELQDRSEDTPPPDEIDLPDEASNGIR